MTAWWQQRTAQERQWLTVTGIVVFVCLFWLLLWQPVLEHRQSLRAGIDSQQAVLLDMQQLAEEAERLLKMQPRNDGAPASDGRSLLALADESARSRGLGEALRRVEPVGENRVRMLLEDAQFAAVSDWLEALQFRLGIEVEEISIERRALAGQVTVRLTLLDQRRPQQD